MKLLELLLFQTKYNLVVSGHMHFTWIKLTFYNDFLYLFSRGEQLVFFFNYYFFIFNNLKRPILKLHYQYFFYFKNIF